MKRLFTILAALLFAAGVFAQAPEKMSYQAVIRNANGELVTNTPVGMQISILQTTSNGRDVYTETQTPTTNANGLISIEIGTGTSSDDFSAIDWSSDTYFIETKTDPTGGTSYTITGTSQLLSVPYALHAKTAVSVLNKPTIPSAADGSETKVTAGTNVTITGSGTAASPYVVNASGGATHYVGEVYGGGVVFYVDHTGEHGLIVSLIDISDSAPWGQDGTTLNTTSTWDGASNSTTIATGAVAADAVKLCQAHAGGGNNDWYLPAIDELNLLYNARFTVNKVLSTATGGVEIGQNTYWSSTERSNSTSTFTYRFSGGSTGSSSRGGPYWVRAVRAF